MRLILLDRLTDKRFHFYPLALSRPIWELRCGMTSLAEKLVAQVKPTDVACFVPPYMAEVYGASTPWPVNDPASLAGDDLFVVHGRVKAEGFHVQPTGPSQIALDADGECLYARISRDDLAKLDTSSIDGLLESAKAQLPSSEADVPTWDYTWDLILENPEQIAKDFAAAGRSGVEGTIEEPGAIRGSRGDV
jgi:hypothetical protein